MPSFSRPLFFLFALAALLAVVSASVSAPADLAVRDVEASDLAGHSSDLEKRKRRRRRHRGHHHRSHHGGGHHHKGGGGKKHGGGGSSSAGGSLTSSATRTGDMTYFQVGLGACGHRNTDSDMIAAASHILYDNFPGATANPNDNPICGRKLQATYGGHSVVVTIVDRCAACAEFDLDFSPTAFQKLGEPLSAGRLHGMTWHWI